MASSEATSLEAPAAQPASAPGILTFIIADMIIFGVLFTGFMVDRSKQLALFNQSSAMLNFDLGILNLMILVTSGLCVVFAVAAAREGRVVAIRNWILAAFVIGFGFAVSKVIEWSDKFAHGISMQTNPFFMYYFALTGAHLLHFIAGMAALVYIWIRTFHYASEKNFFTKIEAIGLYWHMVDLLWIFIFPLLYVLGMEGRLCP